MERIRAMARAKDSESTFTGEAPESAIPGSLEHVTSFLDYTWGLSECGGDAKPGPIQNVLRSPRMGCGVEESPLLVKKGFCDGLYLAVYPKKPDGPNGSELISRRPEIASALKETAALRKRFLSFFVDGIYLEDSFLREPCSAYVRAYQKDDSLFIAVLNDKTQPQAVTVKNDLDLWLPSTGRYRVNYYDSGGKLVETTSAAGADWVGVTRLLQPLEMAFFEIQLH